MHKKLIVAIDKIANDCDLSETAIDLCGQSIAFFNKHEASGLTQKSLDKTELATKVARHLGSVWQKRAGSQEHKVMLALNEIFAQKIPLYIQNVDNSADTPEQRTDKALRFLAEAFALTHSKQAKEIFSDYLTKAA